MTLTLVDDARGRRTPPSPPAPDRRSTGAGCAARSPSGRWPRAPWARSAPSLGSLVAGRLAEDATERLVWLLALCVVGAALFDTVARTLWAGTVDRAEGRLRADLLDAALHQPLSALTEQAVGEVLDRVDDDTHEVGVLLRQSVWQAIRTVLASGPLWLVAGTPGGRRSSCSRWPGVAALAVVRPLLPQPVRAQGESRRWPGPTTPPRWRRASPPATTCARAWGRRYVLRRCTELAAGVHHRFAVVLGLEAGSDGGPAPCCTASSPPPRCSGSRWWSSGRLGTASLVTLFLVTTMFVGQVDQLARHLPDLQAGLRGGAAPARAARRRARSPTAGRTCPTGSLDVRFADLHFAYAEGRFALQHVDLARRRPARPARWSGAPGPASRPWPRCSRARSSRSAGRCSSAASTCSTSTCSTCAPRSARSPSAPRSWPARSPRTSRCSGRSRAPRSSTPSPSSASTAWVAGLPRGLDTLLGPGGTSLSSGEEQLVAFARLLVRDVRVVVLDEATARMDPVTEANVVRAAERLLAGRTGILVAHRLSTTARAEQVAVLDGGRVVQQGPRARLAREPGAFRTLLEAATEDEQGHAARPAARRRRARLGRHRPAYRGAPGAAAAARAPGPDARDRSRRC